MKDSDVEGARSLKTVWKRFVHTRTYHTNIYIYVYMFYKYFKNIFMYIYSYIHTYFFCNVTGMHF